MLKKIPLLLMALSLVACATTTTGDPREGGLFGWSEEKARMRQQERQQNLDQIQRDTSKQRDVGRDLTRRKAEEEKLFRDTNEELRGLERDLAGIEAENRKLQVRTQRELTAKKEMEKQIAQKKAAVRSLKQDTSKAMKDEKELNEEIDQLKSDLQHMHDATIAAQRDRFKDKSSTGAPPQ